MCMIDWKILRLARTVSHNVQMAGNGTFFIPNNPQRIGLFLPVDYNAAGVVIAIDRLPTGTDSDFISTAGYPLYLHINKHGDMPTRSFGVANLQIAGTSVNWIEVLLPEIALTIPLQR